MGNFVSKLTDHPQHLPYPTLSIQERQNAQTFFSTSEYEDFSSKWTLILQEQLFILLHFYLHEVFPEDARNASLLKESGHAISNIPEAFEEEISHNLVTSNWFPNVKS